MVAKIPITNIPATIAISTAAAAQISAAVKPAISRLCTKIIPAPKKLTQEIICAALRDGSGAIPS